MVCLGLEPWAATEEWQHPCIEKMFMEGVGAPDEPQARVQVLIRKEMVWSTTLLKVNCYYSVFTHTQS